MTSQLTTLSPPAASASAVSASPVNAILSEAQAGRFVLQDFCPLADSIEWELGQHYWRTHGSTAFTGPAPVPYVINNDGVLSRHTAAVVFAALAAADAAGALEPEIFVLELGIGVGLFARFFLDALRDLCRQSGKDYYDRLTYVAGDSSAAMLRDACRHGVFAGHPGHYLLRLVDALQPEAALAADPALACPSGRPFRAVFLNYLLDCLPAADLKVSGNDVRQLCVRTCLARHLDLREHTDAAPDDLARWASASDPAERRRLMDHYGLFASEYDYRPVAADALPYGACAVAYGQSVPHFLHNHGALQALERLLALLHPEGLLLVNDYGQTEVDRGDDFEHQRFADATAVGVNFPLLKAYFDGGQRCQWHEPAEDSGRIHSRLLCLGGNPSPNPLPAAERGPSNPSPNPLPEAERGPSNPSPNPLPEAERGQLSSPPLRFGEGAGGRGSLDAAIARFRELFGKAQAEALQAPVDTARKCWQAGRFEAALNHYHDALERQPSNWLLMNEVAQFLTFTLRNPAAGAAVMRVALALNPACAAELWNTFGDCLYEGGRLDEARRCYERALRVEPGDVKGLYNLAWVDMRERAYGAALGRIAEALARDQTGEFYDRLVKKQAEVLGLLAQRQQQRYLLLANRVSKLPAAAEVERKASLPAVEAAAVKEGPKPPTDPPPQRA